MILAVDGGGTKTNVLLAEQNGMIISEAEGGPLSFSVVSPQNAIENLHSTIHDALAHAHVDEQKMSQALIGLAGIDSPAEVAEAQAFFSGNLKDIVKDSVEVVNDTEIALASGSQAANAMVIIAGTGSNCIGHNSEGKTAKAGGLDYILSDEGSGFYIGREGLIAAIKSADGRGEKTMLEDLIKQHYGISAMYELKARVFKPDFNKTKIAQAAILVSQAADDGDVVAGIILTKARLELVALVKAVAWNLNFYNRPFDMVMVGSVLKNNVVDVELFKTEVCQSFPEVSPILPEHPPVYGALNLLLRKSE